jgi:hypothetical protein
MARVPYFKDWYGVGSRYVPGSRYEVGFRVPTHRHFCVAGGRWRRSPLDLVSPPKLGIRKKRSPIWTFCDQTLGYVNYPH